MQLLLFKVQGSSRRVRRRRYYWRSKGWRNSLLTLPGIDVPAEQRHYRPYNLLTPDEKRRIVTWAQSGDKQAIEAIIIGHEVLIHGRVARLMPYASVDDMLDMENEIRIRIVQKIQHYSSRPNVTLTTWLYRLSSNLVISKLRKRSRVTCQYEAMEHDIRHADDDTQNIMQVDAWESFMGALTEAESSWVLNMKKAVEANDHHLLRSAMSRRAADGVDVEEIRRKAKAAGIAFMET